MVLFWPKIKQCLYTLKLIWYLIEYSLYKIDKTSWTYSKRLCVCIVMCMYCTRIYVGPKANFTRQKKFDFSVFGLSLKLAILWVVWPAADPGAGPQAEILHAQRGLLPLPRRAEGGRASFRHFRPSGRAFINIS